ncbi:MAG: hypothetical protein IIB39_00335 [Candidatus Marinimicrobia bacterium]|nr:hypothetical protein [Candidatus Neomarinimicrobiota bacterium]
MKYKIISIFLILIVSAQLSGQDEIMNNVRFAETAIKKIVTDSLTVNAIPKEKTYRILSSENEAKTLFVTTAVKEALDEMGYTTILDDDVDTLTNIVELNILNPKINFELRDGLRKISGNFKLLLYSKSDGNINWGKEMDLSFLGNDSVKGIDTGLLEQGAPDFLKSKREVKFSSSKMEKFLAGVIAGIITYLLYSVRS